MRVLSILSSGMVTGVGLSAAASCAAMRCAIDNFAETGFINEGGERIIGSAVPLERPWRGRAKLVKLVAPAIRECLDAAGSVDTRRIPLLLCVAEKDRPGRLEGLDDQLLDEVQSALDVRFHERSSIVARGRVAGAFAVGMARDLINGDHLPLCLVAGTDSLLVAKTLEAYDARGRLLTETNSDGFIPGEAGTCVLLGPPGWAAGPSLLCVGLGFARETATIDSGKPLRGDGLAQAIRTACGDGGLTMKDVGYRVADLSGEQYGFKEASLAVSRTVRDLRPRFDLWHPADCIGEVGAAIGPCILGVSLTASRKDYAPAQGALCHFGNDDGERAAMILRSGRQEAA